jgi:hypothetical protein
VASAILAAVFLPLFGAFRGGVRTTKYTEDRLRALTIAQEQLQAIRHAVRINRHSLDRVLRGYLVGTGGNWPEHVVDQRYKLTTEVEPDYEVTFGTVVAYVTWVRVTVTWTLADQPRTLVLETFLDRAYE